MPRVKLRMMAKIILLVTLTILSCFFGFIVFESFLVRIQNIPLASIATSPLPAKHDLSDKLDISWFAHVTDTHLSMFHDPERGPELLSLCKFLKETVIPIALIVSGDLTDAKLANNVGSQQHPEEWQSYRDIIEKCNLNQSGIPWLDLRGNHDTFNVAHDLDTTNFFRNFSAQGMKNPRSYSKVVASKTSMNKKIGFVGSDLTPVPGLRRPFNFFGVLSRQALLDLQTALNHVDNESDFQVVFGHYPTSAVTGLMNIRQLLANRIYMCGHFHSVFGNNFEMYTRHDNGLLELELGDWKDYRTYRIAAIDANEIAIADNLFNPMKPNFIVLVTNPIDPRFLRSRSSLEKMKNSASVRVLVFSDQTFDNVELVFPDESFVTMEKKVLDGFLISPLYIAPWSPEKYSKGLHHLCIRVKKNGTITYSHRHPFSLDGTQEEYRLSSRLILMLDWPDVAMAAFITETLGLFLFLLAFRMFTPRHGRFRNMTFPWSYCRKFMLLAVWNRTFYALISALLWHSLLPWMFVIALHDKPALIFAWGVLFLDDFTIAPPDISFSMANITMILHFFPLVWVLASRLDSKFDEIATSTPKQKKSYISAICSHFPFFILIFLVIVTIITVYKAFGLISVISPYSLGKMLFFFYIYKRISNFSLDDKSEIILSLNK